MERDVGETETEEVKIIAAAGHADSCRLSLHTAGLWDLACVSSHGGGAA